MKVRAQLVQGLMLGSVVVTALLLVRGCGGRRLLEFPLTGECKTHNDCAQGQVCQLGYCRTACLLECPEQQVCILGACYAKNCPNEECVGNEVCILEQCGDPRCSGQSCAPWFCHPELGECVACISDANCPLSAPFCDPTSHTCICEAHESDCHDGIDSDCDGTTDCDDPDCNTACCGGSGSACCVSPPDSCDPGYVCESTICVPCGGKGEPCCDLEHDCINGIDDDCDGDADCDDNECAAVCTGCGLPNQPCCSPPDDPCIAGHVCDTGGTDTCIACGEGGPLCCSVSESQLGLCDCGWPDGTDLAGADLTLTDGQVVSGRYKRVKNFVVPAGVTATVAAYDGTGMSGQLQVCATSITIAGTLDATGAGYAGGCGGHGASCIGPGAPGEAGSGSFGGIEGTGGASSNRGAGTAGVAAAQGGYAAAGANGDTCGGETLLLGSGGGGGGGGGSSYGPDCASYGVSGGGGGGAGGPGGGAISLLAHDSIDVTGSLLANGSTGGDGGNGLQRNPTDNCANPCSFGGAAGDPDMVGASMGGSPGAAGTSVGQGGSGGAGGGGAGGGILVKAQSIVITGDVSTVGGSGDIANGGTLKIFYRGSAPTGTLNHGMLCSATY